MNNLAVAILDGNLTADPETKKLSGGKTVTHFTIALNHEYGKKEGNKQVSFIQIETWDKQAETCATYLKKGSRVTISGDIRQDRWKDGDGKNHSRVKILARNVRFDSTRKSEGEGAENAA